MLKKNRKIGCLTDRYHPTLSILPNKTANIIRHKSSAVAEMGDRLATIGMGRKWGESCGRLGPHSVPI